MVLQFFWKGISFSKKSISKLKYWNRSNFPWLSHKDMLIFQTDGFWKSLVPFFRRIYALSVDFKMKPPRKCVSSVPCEYRYIKGISKFSCRKENVDKNILKTLRITAENHATYADNMFTSYESNTSESNIRRIEAPSYPA